MTVPVVQILTACPTLTVMGYGLLSTAGVSWAATGGIVTAERSDVSARLRATSKTFLFMFSLLFGIAQCRYLTNRITTPVIALPPTVPSTKYRTPAKWPHRRSGAYWIN